MKKICMIATGGTIASEAGINGLRPALTGENLLRLVPQLGNLASIDCREILQLDSSNLLPKHWQLMARTVAEAYEAYDGFVITHGTDTMAYSAAALNEVSAVRPAGPRRRTRRGRGQHPT